MQQISDFQCFHTSHKILWTLSEAMTHRLSSSSLVKFRDPRLNRSREIPPEDVGGGIFDRFSSVVNFQLEADMTSYLVWL